MVYRKYIFCNISLSYTVYLFYIYFGKSNHFLPDRKEGTEPRDRAG